MARIREYTSQVNLHVPQGGQRLLGEHFGAQTGRSIRQFGQALTGAADRINRRMVQEDISTANKNLSEVQIRYTQKWDEAARTASPDDKNFHEKFLEEFENDISKFGENLSTREGRDHYQQAASKLRATFLTKAQAVQSTLAGIKAKSDYTTTINNLTSALITDPSALDVSLELHDSTINGLVSSGLLPSNKAEELRLDGRKTLAESAVKGWIKQDPWKTKNDIKAGKWDGLLDGNKKYQLLEESESEIRARRVENDRVEALRKKVERERHNATRAEFMEKALTYQLTAKEVMDSDLPTYGAGGKMQFINMLKRQSKSDLDQTNPVLYNDIFSRIHLDPEDEDAINDESELLDYAFGNGLSQDDVAFLSREIRAKKAQPHSIESKMKKKLMDDAAKNLTRTNKLTGYIDEAGEDRVHKFSAFIAQEYDSGIKAGKTPMDLLDPQSPNYLGKFMPQFQKSDKEIMSEMATEKRRKEQIRGFNKKQKEAYEWAIKNKNDPRSKAILERLGMGAEE